MKKLIAAAGIGAALTIAPLAVAGTASASNGSYVSEMTNAGFYNTAGNSAMVARGHEICQYLDWGYSQYQVQDYAIRNTGASIGWADAGQMVAIAMNNLC